MTVPEQVCSSVQHLAGVIPLHSAMRCAGIATILILQMRKVKCMEVKKFAQDTQLPWWGGWDSSQPMFDWPQTQLHNVPS